MRIGILNHGFPPDVGGGETQAYITASTLQKHGHDVHVFTGKADQRLSFPFDVSYLEHFKSFEKGESGLKYFIKELHVALQAAGEFDILYCSNFSALLAVSFLRGIVNTPIVFTFHCVPVEELSRINGYFNDWTLEKTFTMNELTMGNPAVTVCPSSFFYKWAEEFGAPKNKLVLIYNSVLIENFRIKASAAEKRLWRKEHNIPEDAFLFLMPARMVRKKGLYEVVRAAKKVSPCAFFYVVSSRKNADPVYLEEIETLINSNKLNDRIKVAYDMYSVDEMPTLYAMCDTVLLPSHHEGLPLTIIEAMASRKLVLCSDIPALQEIVDDGKNGITCKAKDVTSLVQSMTKVLDLSNSEYKKLTDNAYQTVLDKFDADKNIKELEEIFTKYKK